MLLISLPAYNEEKSIVLLLRNIDQFMKSIPIDYKILILDDGSTDNTLKILNSFSKKLPLIVVRHKKNQGLGKTLNDILKKSAKITKQGDIIVTMDADNTHHPILIKKMINLIRQNYDVVIASRYKKGGKEIGFPFHRTFLSRIACNILKILINIKNVKDYTCGYRAYKASLIKKSIIRYNSKIVHSNGFPGMAEILFKLKKMKIKAIEIPLVLRYDLKKGKSKMKLSKTIIEYIKMISRNIIY